MTLPTVVITDTNEATSGDITVMAPGSAWFRTGDKVFVNIRSATYRWTASATSGEYYLELAAGGDPGITNSDVRVYYSGHRVEQGTPGSLAELGAPSFSYSGSYGVGDNDSLGFTTIYIKINTGSGAVDPDTLTAGRIYYSYANSGFAYGAGSADTVDRIAWDFGDPGSDNNAGIGWNGAHCYEERLTSLNGTWTASGSEWIYDTPVTAGTNPRVYQDGGTGYSGNPMTLGTAGALTAGQFAFDGTALHVRLTGDANPNSAADDEIAFANQYSCTVTCTVTNSSGESASATRTVLVNPCTRTRQWFDSDAGDNANAGTKASPKKDLDGATRNVANYRWMLKNGTTATYRHHEQQNDNQVLQGYGPGATAVVQNNAAQNWTIMTRGGVNVWMDFVLLGKDDGVTWAGGFVSNTSANEDSGVDGYWTVLRVVPRTAASGGDMASFINVSSLFKGLLVQGCDGETSATSGMRDYLVFAVPGQAVQVHPARHIVVCNNDNGYGSRDEAITRIEGCYVSIYGNTFTQTDSDQTGNARWKSGVRWPGGSNHWVSQNTCTNCNIGINPASNSVPASEFVWERNLLVNDGDGTDPDNAGFSVATASTVTGGTVRNNICDSRSAAGTSTAGWVNLDLDDYSTGTMDGTRFLGNSFLGGVNTTQFYTLRVSQNAAGDVSGLIWRANCTVNPSSTADASVTSSDAYIRANEIDDAGDDLFAELDANVSAPLAGRTGTGMSPDHIAIVTTSAPADTFKSWADLEGLAGVTGGNNEELDLDLAGVRVLIDGMTPRATPTGLRRTYDDLTRVAVTYSGAAYATDLSITASGEIGTNEIVVDFGTEIDAATLSTASFGVERDGNPVPFSVPSSVSSSQTVTLTLSANLFSSSDYVVDFSLGEIVLAGGVVFVNTYADIPVTLTGGTVSGSRSRDRSRER